MENLMSHGLDNGMLPFLGGTIGFIIILFLFVHAVLWFFLPFAIFGPKEKPDNIEIEIESTNKLLQVIDNEIKETRLSNKGSGNVEEVHMNAIHD
jgi:hypothetical protein